MKFPIPRLHFSEDGSSFIYYFEVLHIGWTITHCLKGKAKTFTKQYKRVRKECSKVDDFRKNYLEDNSLHYH